MQKQKSTTLFVPSYDGVNLSVRYYGDIKNKVNAFFCISGLGGSSTAWDVFAETIQEQLPDALIISFDMRGHNKSGAVFPPLLDDIFRTLALDVEALCQHFGLSEPIFIGHSLGGLVVLSYLEHTPGPIPVATYLLNTPFVCKFLPTAFHKPLYSLMRHCAPLERNNRKMFTPEMHAKYKNSWDFSPGRVWQDISCMGIFEFFLFWLVTLSAPKQTYATEYATQLHCIYGEKDLVVSKENILHLHSHFLHSKLFGVDTNHNSIVNKPEIIARYVLATRASAVTRQVL